MTFRQYIEYEKISDTAVKKRLVKFGTNLGQTFTFRLGEEIPQGFAEWFAKPKSNQPQKVRPKVAEPKPSFVANPIQSVITTKKTKFQNLVFLAKSFANRGSLLLLINWLETIISFRGGFIKYGHMGLVVVSAALAFYWYVILEAKDDATGMRREFSLFVCAVLSCLFAYLHIQAFNEFSPTTYLDNCVFAAILSTLGWLANYFTIPRK